MKNSKIFFSIAVVLLFGVLFACEETIISHKPQDMRIVFYSYRDSAEAGAEVFIMDANGENQEQITNLDLIPCNLYLGYPFEGPLWASSKEKIVFTTMIGESYAGLVVMNSDGTGLDTLASGIFGCALWDVSPNGDKLSCGFGGELPRPVHIVNVDGTGEVTLDLDCGAGGARFCGNNRVVYTNYTEQENIFIINADGTGEAEQLTDSLISGFPCPHGVSYYMPVGSPNGEKIAFGVSLPIYCRHYALGIMNSDGSEDTLLSYECEFVGMSEIEFSPNGQRLLFLPIIDTTVAFPPGKIYVISVDGSGLDSLTEQIVCTENGASWSPDGDWIVFTSNKDGNKNIYKVSTDGNTLVRLTDNDADDFSADW